MKLVVFDIIFDDKLGSLQKKIGEVDYDILKAFVVVDNGVKIIGAEGVEGDIYQGFIVELNPDFTIKRKNIFLSTIKISQMLDDAGYTIPEGWNV